MAGIEFLLIDQETQLGRVQEGAALERGLLPDRQRFLAEQAGARDRERSNKAWRAATDTRGGSIGGILGGVNEVPAVLVARGVRRAYPPPGPDCAP